MRLLKYFEKRCKELGLGFDEQLFQEPETKRPRLDEDDEENSESDSDDEQEAQKKR